MKNALEAVDVFIRSQAIPEEGLGTDALKLAEVYCRGTKLDPNSIANCLLTDVFQCRFVSRSKQSSIELREVAQLLSHLVENNFHWVQIQNVYNYQD